MEDRSVVLYCENHRLILSSGFPVNDKIMVSAKNENDIVHVSFGMYFQDVDVLLKTFFQVRSGKKAIIDFFTAAINQKAKLEIGKKVVLSFERTNFFGSGECLNCKTLIFSHTQFRVFCYALLEFVEYICGEKNEKISTRVESGK